MTVEMLAPTSRVNQTGSTYTVQLAITGDVADSVALLGVVAPDQRPLPDQRSSRSGPSVKFGPTIQLTNLKPGRCYQVYVAAIDEEATTPRRCRR